MRVVVVGGGVFGATAAVELRLRGHEVTLLDAGKPPNPLAASTDISKMIRADYAADEHYAAMMEEAFPRWRDWNAASSQTLFHETGFLILSSTPFEPGSYELSSFETLTRRGHRLERLDADAIAERFPAWRPGQFVDGYLNPAGGFAESARVVDWLISRARDLGVLIVEKARVEQLLEHRPGVVCSGQTREVDAVVVATGTWLRELLPELADRVRSVAQPVFHFAPQSPEHFRAPAFLPWAADIARSGWYGFSLFGDVVKVANHGPGRGLDPNGDRAVPEEIEHEFRQFLRDALPELADAPLAATRMCFYADSFDGDLFVDRHPTRPGVVVAGGGSGHAFKLAPLLGEVIADVVDQKPNRWGTRFAFRERGERRVEAARFDG
jgi:sarcosine oxidase